MSFELKVLACNPDDMRRQVIAIAETMAGVSKTPAPQLTLADFHMSDIVDYLASQGFKLVTLDTVEDEIVEQKGKKSRRQKIQEAAEKDPPIEEVEEVVAPVSSVSSTEEGEAVDLDALKTETIERLQELYFVDNGTPIVDRIRKRYAGKKKFSDLPKEQFPEISAELNAALEASAHA